MVNFRPAHLIEAAVFFMFVGLARALDLDRGSALGGRLGGWLAPLGRRPRAYENLGIAFPSLDRQAATRTIDGMYEGIGRMLAEIARLEDYARPSERSRFTFDGLENYHAALATGRPVIIASGHFGNWEMQVPALRHLGIPFADVTQPLDNPFIDRFLSRRRLAAGFTDQIQRGAAGTRELLTRLRAGETIALMVDLRFREGIPVPLFGRLALTSFTPALFARDYRAIILPMALRRETGARFRLVMHPPLEVGHSANPARDVVDLTRAINAFVEEEVRARPSHWMWNHGRWLPRPHLFRRAQQLLDDASAVPPSDQE